LKDKSKSAGPLPLAERARDSDPTLLLPPRTFPR
jgi:hypothetical protein